MYEFGEAFGEAYEWQGVRRSDAVAAEGSMDSRSGRCAEVLQGA